MIQQSSPCGPSCIAGSKSAEGHSRLSCGCAGPTKGRQAVMAQHSQTRLSTPIGFTSWQYLQLCVAPFLLVVCDDLTMIFGTAFSWSSSVTFWIGQISQDPFSLALQPFILQIGFIVSLYLLKCPISSSCKGLQTGCTSSGACLTDPACRLC